MKRYIGINTWFGNETLDNFEEFEFRNNISLLDYDAVILNTYGITSQYNSEKWLGEAKTFQGVEVLDENDSFAIVKDFEKLKRQLIDMLKIGRNLYVFLEKNEPKFIYTGAKKVSGTGKNAKTTNYVEELDIYGFLPVPITVEHVIGEKMISSGDTLFDDFFEKSKDSLYYSQIIVNPQGKAIATVPDTDRVVSMYLEFEKGKIIFLPCPYESEEYEDESEGEKERRALLQNIMELNDSLNTLDEGVILPKWTEDIFILDEKIQREKLCLIEKKIEKVIKEREEKIKKIQELEKYKYLLTESGENLERIVKIVFQEMGFDIQEADFHRTDIVGEYKKIPVVIEVKGLTKSAAEKNAAQLEKWVSEYYIKEGKKAKGILVVNAFRNKPLSQRNEDVFPRQMLAFAESRQHCLISTTQLLCFFVECKKNKKNRDKLIMELLETVGVYEKKFNVSDYLA